ncbi:GumC family protein [Pseudoroseomonas sp. WGS1072]|uniref:GumC family protein n=1 Tax=Roseomonas sp. WGS1072 TaxID=3366816 RepID=UPI003BF166FE
MIPARIPDGQGESHLPALALPQGSHASKETSLGALAGIFRRSRRFIALWILAWLALAFVVIINLQPIYSSSAMVMLNTRQLHYAELREVLTGPATGIDGNAVRSEVEILTSPQLMRRVVEDLELTKLADFQPTPPLSARIVGGLADLASRAGLTSAARMLDGWTDALAGDPDEQTRFEIAVASYQRGLSVFNTGRSFVINVTFQASSPELATRIVNRHVDLYIEDQRRIKNEALTAARSWLDREVEEQANRLRLAERELQEYRERFQLYQPGGTSLTAQRLAEMNAQLTMARADLAQREARLQRVRESRSLAAAGDADTDVQASATISRLREQEAIARRREAEMAAQFGNSHPSLRAARAEVSEVQRKIGEEVGKVLRGLQSEVQISRAREMELRRSVADLEREMGAYERNDAPAREAERQVNITRTLYENLLSRQKQVAAQEGIQQADARVVSYGTPPLLPSFPRKSLLLAISGVVAAVTALGLAMLRDRLRPGFANLGEVEAATGLRGLVALPQTSRRRPPHWQVLHQPKSATAEALRSLRMLLALPRTGIGRIRSLAVTSALPGEGKTSLALALARSLAASGLRVLLIDADLRRPGVARAAFGREAEQGLVDVLSGRLPATAAVASDSVAGLDILPAGRFEGEAVAPQDLLATTAMADLLEAADKAYDYVLVDTPPVGPVSDAALIGRMVQETILVTQSGKSHREAVLDGVAALQMAEVRIAGVVLNGIDPKMAPAHGAYRRGLRAAYFHA